MDTLQSNYEAEGTDQSGASSAAQSFVSASKTHIIVDLSLIHI